MLVFVSIPASAPASLLVPRHSRQPFLVLIRPPVLPQPCWCLARCLANHLLPFVPWLRRPGKRHDGCPLWQHRIPRPSPLGCGPLHQTHIINNNSFVDFFLYKIRIADRHFEPMVESMAALRHSAENPSVSQAQPSEGVVRRVNMLPGVVRRVLLVGGRRCWRNW